MALEYQDIFGKGNFFLEMQDHGIPEQQLVNQRQIQLSKETGIELVVTNDIKEISFWKCRITGSRSSSL